jgi:multiple RNA-binding domain-containing protein 1
LPEHAVKAYTSLDGSIFQGRILEILPGKEKQILPEDEELGADASYKKKLEQKRKKEALNEFSWNSLFINVSDDDNFRKFISPFLILP